MVHHMFEMMSSLLYNLMKIFIFHSAITTSFDGHTNGNQDSDLDTAGVSNWQKKLRQYLSLDYVLSNWICVKQLTSRI